MKNNYAENGPYELGTDAIYQCKNNYYFEEDR